jgi:MFS family permease
MVLILQGLDIFKSSKAALLTLFFLSFIYFLESFDRYLISVSPIPYIDYSSYEYSILTGPAFTVIYTLSGLTIALLYSQDSQLSFCNVSKFNVLAIATFIFSVSFAVTAFATSFYQQVLIRIVMGVTQSIITPFSTAIISSIFPSHVKGSAFAIFNVGTYIAFSMSLSLGTYLYVNFGWRAGYLIFGVLGAACALPIPFLVRINKSARDDSSSDIEDVLRDDSIGGAGSTAIQSVDYSPLVDSDISSGSIHVDQKYLVFDGNNVTPVPQISTWLRMRQALYEVCFVYWLRRPELYLVCLATGVRLGGGYIWSAYTSVFFASLFVAEDPARGCSFSYSDATAVSSGLLAGGAMCGVDFPYCVSEGDHCATLALYPWHNEVSMVRLYCSWRDPPVFLPGHVIAAPGGVHVLGAAHRFRAG